MLQDPADIMGVCAYVLQVTFLTCFPCSPGHPLSSPVCDGCFYLSFATRKLPIILVIFIFFLSQALGEQESRPKTQPAMPSSAAEIEEEGTFILFFRLAECRIGSSLNRDKLVEIVTSIAGTQSSEARPCLEETIKPQVSCECTGYCGQKVYNNA